jgi:hypothetical protein
MLYKKPNVNQTDGPRPQTKLLDWARQIMWLRHLIGANPRKSHLTTSEERRQNGFRISDPFMRGDALLSDALGEGH